MSFLSVKLLCVFLLISVVYSRKQIPTCANNSFYIQHPFRLLQPAQKPPHKSHHDFILKCNTQGFVVLNLPASGDFYVRDINYFHQKIQIYDPDNCLTGRVKNLSLTSSPFVAETYQNYTLFSCPPETLVVDIPNLSMIRCLSNSTASVFASSNVSTVETMMNSTGCNVMYSLNIPISSPFDSVDGDLQLVWNDPSCKEDCKGKSTSISVLSIIIICLFILAVAALSMLFCTGFCLLSMRIMINFSETSEDGDSRVWEMARIRVDWKISGDGSATEEMIIGGSGSISGPNTECCPICLEEYQPFEKLKLICKCSHSFHTHCLDTWLHRETTCPICRTTVV